MGTPDTPAPPSPNKGASSKLRKWSIWIARGLYVTFKVWWFFESGDGLGS